MSEHRVDGTRRGLAWGVLGMLACLSLDALADPAALARARELLGKGEAKAAYETLAPLAGKEAGNPEFDYWLGIAAIDSGRPSEGVFALERVLAVNPDHPQARAEIARGYLMLGELETSRKEFETVRKANPPQEVVATIEKYLGTLDKVAADQRTTVSGFVEASLGDDSNVNAATFASEIAIPDVPVVFPLGVNGRSRRDTYGSVGAGINVRHPVRPDLVLFAGASANWRENANASDFNTGTLDGNFGVTMGAGEHRFSATVQANTFYLDSARFRDALGVSGQWQYLPNPDAQYSAYAQYTQLSYPGAGFKDADRAVLGGAFARAFGGERAPLVFGGLYVGRESPQDGSQRHLEFELVGARLGGQLNVTPATSLFTTLSYEERWHQAGDPLFLVGRNDQQLDLRLGASVALGRGWSVTPQISYTDNRSNIVVNAYERTQVSATARYDF